MVIQVTLYLNEQDLETTNQGWNQQPPANQWQNNQGYNQAPNQGFNNQPYPPQNQGNSYNDFRFQQ